MIAKTMILTVGLFVLATLSPAASAAGPVADAAGFCPPYEPTALANCEITVDVGDRAVSAPQPTITTYCQPVLGQYCLTVLVPGVIWVPFGSAPVPSSSGYVEATTLCPSVTTNLVDWDGTRPCRVSWDTDSLIPQNPVLA